MDGQLSIFDVFSGDVTGGFCFDQDINHIVNGVNAILEKFGITRQSCTFEIWNHVPHLGYRLHDSIYIPREISDDFVDSMQDLVKYGESHGVEVSVLTGGYYAHSDGKALFHIMTMFTDKRQKLKATGTRKALYVA